jgi:hypothetical protein
MHSHSESYEALAVPTNGMLPHVERLYCDTTEQFNKIHPLLGNGTVNTLLHHQTNEALLGN